MFQPSRLTLNPLFRQPSIQFYFPSDFVMQLHITRSNNYVQLISPLCDGFKFKMQNASIELVKDLKHCNSSIKHDGQVRRIDNTGRIIGLAWGTPCQEPSATVYPFRELSSLLNLLCYNARLRVAQDHAHPHSSAACINQWQLDTRHARLNAPPLTKSVSLDAMRHAKLNAPPLTKCASLD